MPKLKTHKGAQSRFHITGSGKIMRTKGGKSHLRIRKAKRANRESRRVNEVNAQIAKSEAPEKGIAFGEVA